MLKLSIRCWKDPCVGSDVEVGRELQLHPENVLPEEIFPSKMDRIWKVIDFLVPIEWQYIFNLCISSPDQVKSIIFLKLIESRTFHGVYHCVVDMCPI